MTDDQFLLKIEDLKTYFFSKEGVVRAVDGLSFTLHEGEVLGIAGESGCGKSVTTQAILRIVPTNGAITGGRILYRDRNRRIVDLAQLNPNGREIREIRGRHISMIFQEPMSSFSPVRTLERQIGEVLRLHQKLSKKEAREAAIEVLRRVGMPSPEQVIDAYPFNLSGGMRQRAMIAMALSCMPSLLIADEPTTAVDVTTQALILDLISDLQQQTNMALIIITHDLAVLAETAQKIVIMYMGREVEYGSAVDLFYHAKHPYTKALIDSIPKLGETSAQGIRQIEGSVPNPYELPLGCVFHPRCPEFIDGLCDAIDPPLYQVAEDHFVRCHLYEEDAR